MSVQSLISSAQGYAGTLVGQASAAMNAAKASIESIGFTIVTPPPLNIPPPPKPLTLIPPPTLSPVTLREAPQPGELTPLQPISPIVPGTMPAPPGKGPVLVLPTKPSQAPDFTKRPPTVRSDFPWPTPPPKLMTGVTTPFPTVDDRTEPDKPEKTIPKFTGIKPISGTVTINPTDTLSAAYRDSSPSMAIMIGGYVDAEMAKINPQFTAQMAAIEAQLTKYLQGGTGLNPAVEDAIYSRARSKNNAEALRVRNQTINEAAARGFTMPSGAMMSAIQQARQSGADNNAAAAREIVVMQAEMEQKNLQFAVTTSASLRATILNATLSYMQNMASINAQAIDYAKSVLSAVIETYNIGVKLFGMKLEAYKAEAQVYEAELRGAMLLIDIYKAEIQAQEMLVNVDRAKIEAYKAEIDSLSSLADMYKSQVDTIVSQANLEKNKVELFQSEVQAYSAQVQAKNSEWGGYTAQLNGETAKAKIYESEVSSYTAQIGAFRADIDAQAEELKGIVATNQATAAQYQAKVSAFNSLTAAYSDKSRSEVENDRQKSTFYKMQLDLQQVQQKAELESYKAGTIVTLKQAEIDVTTMLQSADGMRKYGESVALVSASNAKTYASLAGAAMSGMNSLAAEIESK